MPEPLSAEQRLENILTYISEEHYKHEMDIKVNQGKLNELQEIKDQFANSCIYCWEYVYPGYGNKTPTKMQEHINTNHPPEEITILETSI